MAFDPKFTDVELILIVILLSFSFALVFLGARNIYNLKVVSKWPTTLARIVRRDFEGIGVASEADPVYRPRLTYSYSVGDQHFTSFNLGIQKNSFDFYSDASVRGFISSMPIDSEVLICVNPEDPAHSILSPGASQPRRSHNFALVASGLILLFCTLGFISVRI